MIRNFNVANDHLGGLLNSFWTDSFVLVETLAFSECTMCSPFLGYSLNLIATACMDILWGISFYITLNGVRSHPK